MKKEWMALLLVMLLPGILLAQAVELRGTVQDRQGNLLEFATLTLLREGQETATVMSNQGSFVFPDLHQGQYVVAVRLIGYESMTRQVVLPQDSVISLVLNTSNVLLEEAVVEAQKAIIERKIDRIIFHVESSILASSGTAWDALAKAPGVRANFDGSVTANNKSVSIYLDGKPLRLSGEELNTYLNSLPSAQIARIEVLTNPPAHYDAAGGAVVNIISKRMVQEGLNLNLSASYTYGQYGSPQSGLNFNYRKRKLNLYGNYGFRDSQKGREEQEFITFSAPGKRSLWNSNKKGLQEIKSHAFKVGLDYDLQHNHTVGVLVSGLKADNIFNNAVHTDVFDTNEPMLDSLLETDNRTGKLTANYSVNLNYKGNFKVEGRSLNADLDYASYDTRSNQLANTVSLSDMRQVMGTYRIHTDGYQEIGIFSSRMDISEPLSKDWKLEAGLKYSAINTLNELRINREKRFSSAFDTLDSDKFEYIESNSAGYINLQGKWGTWQLQAGLRGEYTRTTGTSIALRSREQQDYFKLFPTLFLAYELHPEHQLSFYYGARINRPDYWRLNPFKYYSSPYTYMEGNPRLKPAFLTELEVGYTLKQNYNVTMFFRRTEGYFTNISVQDNEANLFYDTQQNLESSLEAGGYVSVPYNPFRWWSSNSIIQMAYKQEKSGYLSGSFDYHTIAYFAQTNHSFLLAKEAGLKAEISGWYTSPTIQGIYRISELWSIGAGISKSIWQNRGHIRLIISDVFLRNNYRIQVNYLDQQNGFVQKNDTRFVTFSMTYKLGKQTIKETRRRSIGSEEEVKRATN